MNDIKANAPVANVPPPNAPPPSATAPLLVLASASPRRAELLGHLGVAFTIEPANVDESALPNETPEGYVERVARLKAAAGVAPDRIVIAADTIVVLDGQVLGKPADPDEARAMLACLSGRRHQVLTCAVVATPNQEIVHLDRAEVSFATLTAGEIEWYVGTGDSLDKAGAYGIQGAAGLFVTELRGNLQTVIGLPMRTLLGSLRELGFDPFNNKAPNTPT